EKGAAPLPGRSPAATGPEREMQIQVGRFTCELSLDERGEVQAQWLPCRSRYLTSGGREQYQVGGEAFLERRQSGINRQCRGSAFEHWLKTRCERSCAAGTCVKKARRVPVNNVKTTVIPLTLPSLQAMALAQFVKRVDFETIARFAAVTVVC